jgi:lambda family phage tail tape measure protein
MSISVGTLIIDLQANTASFVSGMDKAGQIALTNSKNIGRALTMMGASIVAALGAVEVGIVAMVEQAIEAAAKIHDVAQAAGVSTEALSALGYAAKISGVDQESLTKSVEKLSKSMLAAAQQSANGTNAFKTLGIAVTDVNGQLRPTEQVLLDVAEKFAKMGDGSTKTALAMQIFGKAGADMVPLLNEGKAGITSLMDEAKKLGVVIDQDFADAADRFDDSMTKLKAAANGAANSIAKESLPYLNTILDNIAEGSKDTQSRFKDLVDAAGIGIQAFVVGFSQFQTFLDEVDIRIKDWGAKLILSFEGIGKAAKAIWQRDWDGLKQVVTETNDAILQTEKDQNNDIRKLWQDSSDAITEYLLSADRAHGAAPPKPHGHGPKPPNEDQGKFNATIAKQIGLLQEAADKVALLAAAQKGSTAITVEATAAAEAQGVIDKLDIEAKQKKVKGLTAAQRALILQIETEKAYAEVANEVSKTLADETTRTDEQARAVIAMAAAYAQGGDAVAAATVAAKLEPFRDKVNQLNDVFMKLYNSTTSSKAEILAAAHDLANANAQYDAAAKSIQNLSDAQRAANSSELGTNLKIQITNLQAYTKAVLEGAEAVRQEAIEEKVSAAERSGKYDAAGIAQYRKQLQQLSGLEQQRSAAEAIHAQERYKDTESDLKELQKIRAIIVANGQSTLAVDAAIHEKTQEQIHDYDQLLLKVGGVKDGFKAFFNEYENDGVSAAQHTKDVLDQAMQGFTDNVASMLATGKADWKSYFQSIEQMLTKLALNALFKKILGALNDSDWASGLMGGNLFGSGGIFGGPKASGGGIDAGVMYKVHKDEWIVPKGPGTVIPASRTAEYGGRQQGAVYNLHYNIVTPDANSFRKSQSQIMAESFQKAAIAHSRDKR